MVVYKSQNSRYRKDLLFLETTDRVAARAIVVNRRIDFATAVEEQAARVATAMRSRPIFAAAADTEQTAAVAEARTRSRIPDGTY